LWIGLKRTETQGWHWSDSTGLRWSNFKYQPNEYDFIRACGTVSLPSGWWFTDVCDQKMRFMCQHTTGQYTSMWRRDWPINCQLVERHHVQHNYVT